MRRRIPQPGRSALNGDGVEAFWNFECGVPAQSTVRGRPTTVDRKSFFRRGDDLVGFWDGRDSNPHGAAYFRGGVVRWIYPGIPQWQQDQIDNMDILQECRTRDDNFTPRAQQVLALAREEASRFHHNFVGTEHVLLGLVKLGQGIAVSVLQKVGLDLERVRMEIEKLVGTGPDQKMIGNIPYTPRVKKVLSLAAGEAKGLNHTYVGTEHILLGLLREGDGVAARVLKNMNVDVEQTRKEILKELDPNFER